VAADAQNSTKPLLLIALSSSALTGGSQATGTVTLPPTATKPETVALTASNQSVSIEPQTLTVSPGVPYPFVLSTDTTPDLESVVITGHCADYSGSAIVNIMAPQLSRIILSTNSGSSNDTVTGVVQLTGPAPPGGEIIALETSNPAVEVNPPTVTVDHGTDLSAPFQLSTTDLRTIASTIVSASIHYKYITSNIATPVSVSAVSTSSYVLPPGTVIYVTTPEGVSSEHAKLGDIILFTVATDVYGQLTSDPSSRAIIIPRGNPVLGRVRYVVHSKGILQHGRLAVEIDQVEAIDGSLLDVTVSNAEYALPQDKKRQSEIKDVTKNGETHAVITGRTDSTLVPAVILSLGATYALTTINVSTGVSSVDVLGLAAIATSGNFNTLFGGVPATLPAGVTFAVQTTEPDSIQVRNPIAGE